MSTHSNDPNVDQPEDEVGQDKEGAGAEIGITEGEGNTFEPEEDPEAPTG
jgi:hypothetical protein